MKLLPMILGRLHWAGKLARGQRQVAAQALENEQQRWLQDEVEGKSVLDEVGFTYWFP